MLELAFRTPTDTDLFNAFGWLHLGFESQPTAPLPGDLTTRQSRMITISLN